MSASAPSARATSLRGSTTPSPPPVTPLAVPPREACRLLSLGISRIYALMRTGELASYGDGRARRITVASIYGYIERRLADADSGGWRTWPHNPRARASKAEKRA
jgi:excisionase family DNA binding protein